MPRTQVGIREFRANLARILESKISLKVTRHGEALDVFIPVGARPKPANLPRSAKPTGTDLEAVRRAGAKMDAMIAAMGTPAEEFIAAFEQARREKRASRTRT